MKLYTHLLIITYDCFVLTLADPLLALGLKKGDDVFPLIYYLHWATEREKGGEVGESGMPVTGALMPGITERNLLCSLISL